MKVIIQGYNTCCQNKAGGVQTRIRKIASLLQERGVEVELFNPFSSDISTCNALHVFLLGIENYHLILCAKKQHKIVVMSAVIPLENRIKHTLYRWLNKLPITTTYKVKYRTLQLCDYIIVETDAEADFLNKYFSVPQEKVFVIPNGMDDEQEYMGEEIYSAIGKHCEYILQVGRFDANKNQLNVIYAMRGTGVDIVFVGGADHSGDSYYQKCEDAARGYDNIHMLGWQQKDSPILKSAFAKAKLVILPSFKETFGLVALEGGAAGANLAFSNTLPILCYSSLRGCKIFSPDNVSQIREVLTDAFSEPRNPELKKKLMEEFNWNKIIDQHIKLYEGTIR